MILDPGDGGEIWQLIVPESLRKKVYEGEHKHGGHFVSKSTLELMRRSYYWLSMANDVQTWVTQCRRCTLAKDVYPRIRVLAMDYTVRSALEISGNL